MSIPFTRWPEEFSRRYREKGYWQDLPLTDILTRHAASDSIAVIDGERQLSYRELNQAADNLACSLRRQGIKPGETALVQLGNVAELYITFYQVRLFAGAGIVPASSPLGEWRETGVKLSTMLNVFGLH